jgi:hypothetical protein
MDDYNGKKTMADTGRVRPALRPDNSMPGTPVDAGIFTAF